MNKKEEQKQANAKFISTLQPAERAYHLAYHRALERFHTLMVKATEDYDKVWAQAMVEFDAAVA